MPSRSRSAGRSGRRPGAVPTSTTASMPSDVVVRQIQHSDDQEVIHTLWADGFAEMGPTVRDLVFFHPAMVCGSTLLTVGLATWGLDSLDTGLMVGVAFLAFWLTLLPPLFAALQRMGISRIWDMRVGHMLLAWAPANPAAACMWVATDATHGTILGVAAVMAGPAAATRLSLKDMGPASAAGRPLHGPCVVAAALRAGAAQACDALPEHRPVCSVFRVAVHPNTRGRGVGRALMAAAETWAVQHGFSALQLTTAAPGAINFYSRLGYTVHHEKVRLGDFRVVHMSKSVGE